MPPTQAQLTDPTTPIAVIGLGYVGLPLAVEFGKQRPVIGFDIKPVREHRLTSINKVTSGSSPEIAASLTPSEDEPPNNP